VAAARAVRDALALDRLVLVVANDPWQKSPTRVITPAEDRFAMARALAKGIPGTQASRMEIDRGGPSYTVMTAEALVAEAADSGSAPPDIYLVVGADLVADLWTWERVDDLKALVTLAIVSRPPAPGTNSALAVPPADPPGWRVTRVDGPQVDVSSSAVRQVLARGGSIDDMVPAEVVRCILRRNLYAVDR
jgi:nicotinate-nucleotide adenylyltransferase